MSLAGVSREHHVLLRVPLEPALWRLFNGADGHPRTRVAHPCRGPDEDWGAPGLAGGEGGSGEVVGLLAVRRLEDRHPGKCSKDTGVLLVLGAVHPGIVSDEDHEAATHPDEGTH